jgi:hypothetical protein
MGNGFTANKLSKPNVKYYGKRYRGDPRYRYGWPIILCEKIGADFYTYLSRNIFLVPKTRFNVVNSNNGNKASPTVRICSKWVDDLFIFKESPCISQDKLVIRNPFASCPDMIEVKGYLRLAIIARFLNDWDAIKEENIGIKLDPATNEPILVNLDPGMVCSPGMFWTTARNIFPLEQDIKYPLIDIEKIRKNKSLRLELANTVNDIVHLSCDDIAYLIKGDGKNRQFNTIPFDDPFFQEKAMTLEDYQEKLINIMVARRDYVKKMHADDLRWLEFEMKDDLLSPLPGLLVEVSQLTTSSFNPQNNSS